MQKSIGSFPKDDMGFPAVFTKVGKKQKRPDVGILSLLSSSPQSFSLRCSLHSFLNVMANRVEKAVGKEEFAS